jgi:hypothetical protein
MLGYTPEQLQRRNHSIQSHIQFGKFLDAHIINALIHLFENTPNGYSKITNYIINERKLRGLNDTNINITSMCYGETKNDPTLMLIIKKNNKDLIHLSIHFTIKDLNPKHGGILHMRKNIYKPLTTKYGRKVLYAPIYVQQPINKSKSLHFSIPTEYTISTVNNEHNYDYILQQEMDVIITVLNRIFDEDNTEYYIGSQNRLNIIHNKTNSILENINRHRKYTTRKNIGIKMNPILSNESILYINRSNRKINKLKHIRTTRKIHT